MRLKVCFLFIVLLSVATAFTEYRSYRGYKLVSMRLENQEAIDHFRSVIDEANADVWSNDGNIAPRQTFDVLLSPNAYEQIVSLMDFPLSRVPDAKRKVSSLTVSYFAIIHKDIQHLLDQERTQLLSRSNDTDFFSKYRTFDEISQFTTKLAQNYSSVASTFVVGNTWEGRQILGLKITVGNNASKPILAFNGLQHAREWIASMVPCYAMQQLLESYAAGDARVVSLLNKIDVFIVPVVNADGFAYSHQRERLWRKNRRDNRDGTFGVDLNRNYNVGYGIGASSRTSSDTYMGPNPLSEPEANGMAKYLEQYKKHIKAGIDFHSYSQLVLRSWGYTNQLAPDEVDMRTIGAAMQQAILNTHQVKYQNIRGVELYPAGGGLDDFGTGQIGYYGYTIELRDTGRYGFLLPASQIVPTCEENFNAILALGEKRVAPFA